MIRYDVEMFSLYAGGWVVAESFSGTEKGLSAAWRLLRAAEQLTGYDRYRIVEVTETKKVVAEPSPASHDNDCSTGAGFLDPYCAVCTPLGHEEEQ